MAPDWMEVPRRLQAEMEKLGGSRLPSMTQLWYKRGTRIKRTDISQQLQAEMNRARRFQAGMEGGGARRLQAGTEEALVSA